MSKGPLVSEKRALIFGGHGFVGSHLAKKLELRDWTVMCPLHHEVDIADFHTLNKCFAEYNPDVVVNCVAYGVSPVDRNREEIYKSNFLGPWNIYRAVRDYSSRYLNSNSFLERLRFIHLGSCFEKTVKPDMYAMTKAAAMDLLKSEYHDNKVEFDMLLLRPFQIWGPGEGEWRLTKTLINAYLDERTMKQGESDKVKAVMLGDGRGIRDFIHVSDATAYMADLIDLERIPAGAIIEIGSGKGISVREYAERASSVLGIRDRLVFDNSFNREVEPAELIADTTSLREYIAVRDEINIEEGIEIMKNSLDAEFGAKKNKENNNDFTDQISEMQKTSANSMNKLGKKLISIIVPVKNEEECIQEFYRRLNRVLKSLKSDYEFEVVFQDNHSTDKSYSILENLCSKDSRLRAVRFAKDIGYQRSIYHALRNVDGDAVIIIDCDLQDPPEMIEEFLKNWLEGNKVVYGIRRNRAEGGLLPHFRKLFYRLINLISEDNLPLDAGDFRLVDKTIIEELRRINSSDPYIRGSIAAMGMKQKGISYDRDIRYAGNSKFPMMSLIRLSLDGIVNHSTLPLRLSIIISAVAMLAALCGAIIYGLGRILFFHRWPRGFTTLAVLQLMAISLNALILGIQGEYISRIYRLVKGSPPVIIECSTEISE